MLNQPLKRILVAAVTTLAIPVIAQAASLGPVSEENPPAICDIGSFVSAVECSGRYCDRISISCMRLQGARLGRSIWTPWVSEEGGGRRNCPGNHFIAGVACRGKYCDNISLNCVEVSNAGAFACRKSRSVSEENGELNFLAEIFADKAGQMAAATGIRCSGRYCDNKTFDVCEVAPR